MGGFSRRGWFLVLSTAILGHAGVAGAQPAVAADDPSGSVSQRPTITTSSPPNEAGLVLPRLLEFVEADYPPAAREAGIEGEVILELGIDTEGRVTDVAVEQPAGHGFDEAAAVVAWRFRFEPARRQGRSVAAKLLYRYRFTLERVAVSAPVTVGRLKGRVAVGTVGIPAVQVTLAGPNGYAWSGTTGEDGGWDVPDLAPGDYTVSISAAGYAAASYAERVAAGELTEVTYALAPAPGDQGIDITVYGEPHRYVTRRRITRREFTHIAGTNGDPIRAVESMPGVARTGDGSLVIRGASPLSTGVFVDGTSVPFIYHVYNLASVIQADLVDTVTLYPGNFGAKYGRFVGGMVEVGIRPPNVTCTAWGEPKARTGCYHGLAQVDIIDGRLQLEGPIPRMRNLSFLVALRRSWVDYFIKKAAEQTDLGLTVAPRYTDYFATIEHARGERRLGIRAMGAQDEIGLVADESFSEDDAHAVGKLRLVGSYHRGQILYEDRLSRSMTLRSSLGIGMDRLIQEWGDLHLRYELDPVELRQELSAVILPELEVSLGLDTYIAPYRLDARFNDTETAVGPLEDLRVDGTDGVQGYYLEAIVRPSKRSSLVPGLRLDHVPSFDEVTLGPRLVGRYDLIRPRGEPGTKGWRRRTTVKGGTGLFFQPPSLLMVDIVGRLPDQRSERAFQHSVGVEQELTKQVELSVEGFYIDTDRLLTSVPRDDGGRDLENQGARHSFGLETLLRYHADERFFGWVAYTLSRSVTRDAPGEPEHLTRYDQTHNLILVASYRLRKRWEISGRFRYVTGSPYTDIVPLPHSPSVFDGNTGEYVPQSGNPLTDRFPDAHQVDLRVEKRWQYRRWALTGYLDVRNAYNQRIVDFFYYNFNYTDRAMVQGLPLLPTLGVRGEF
ncbi:MAG: TonB family protein [Polyangiaceae bacterium]|nr:TonB family protein [Polyangiaceae bacterium]